MEIENHTWATGTRPCSFCLSLQGDSVFADFDVDADGRVRLVRISFDGFDCCETEGNATRMPLDESHTLVRRVAEGDVNCDEIRGALYRYFDQNANVIWRDAIVEHGLLKP